MISKRDYFEYFQQVLAIEIQMEQTYRQMIISLTNTKSWKRDESQIKF